MGALHQTTGPQPEEQVDLSQGACKQQQRREHASAALGVAITSSMCWCEYTTRRQQGALHQALHTSPQRASAAAMPQKRCRKSDAANAMPQTR